MDADTFLTGRKRVTFSNWHTSSFAKRSNAARDGNTVKVSIVLNALLLGLRSSDADYYGNHHMSQA
jgi:hypothetical protein